jgi:hypothetical protein
VRDEIGADSLSVKARNLGNEAECRQWMRRCVALENPIIELEWYLARHEAQ